MRVAQSESGGFDVAQHRPHGGGRRPGLGDGGGRLRFEARPDGAGGRADVTHRVQPPLLPRGETSVPGAGRGRDGRDHRTATAPRACRAGLRRRCSRLRAPVRRPAARDPAWCGPGGCRSGRCPRGAGRAGPGAHAGCLPAPPAAARGTLRRAVPEWSGAAHYPRAGIRSRYGRPARRARHGSPGAGRRGPRTPGEVRGMPLAVRRRGRARAGGSQGSGNPRSRGDRWS